MFWFTISFLFNQKKENFMATPTPVHSTLWTSLRYDYYQTNKKVLEAKKMISEVFDPLDAIPIIQGVYTDGERFLRQRLTNKLPSTFEFSVSNDQQGIPICVALNLLKLLSMDLIQFEDQLRHELAKSSRIFLDLTWLASSGKHRTVDPATLITIKEGLTNIKKALPVTEVATMYEIDCCLATTSALESAKNVAEDLFSATAEDGIKALLGLAPQELVVVGKKASKEILTLIKYSWFEPVVLLYMGSKETELTKQNLNTAIVKFCKKNKNSIEEIKDDNHHVGFCFLEALINFMNFAVESGTIDVQNDLFMGTLNAPGIIDFINIGLPDPNSSFFTKAKTTFHNASTNWWRVRYRTIDYLFRLFQYRTATQLLWNNCASIITQKNTSEAEHPLVMHLISSHYDRLKQKVKIEGRSLNIIGRVTDLLEKIKLKPTEHLRLKDKIIDLNKILTPPLLDLDAEFLKAEQELTTPPKKAQKSKTPTPASHKTSPTRGAKRERTADEVLSNGPVSPANTSDSVSQSRSALVKTAVRSLKQSQKNKSAASLEEEPNAKRHENDANAPDVQIQVKPSTIAQLPIIEVTQYNTFEKN